MPDSPIIDRQAVETVKKHAEKGDTIFIGQNHVGRAKIKIRHGPLKLLTKRLDVDADTLDAIKSILRAAR
jgi:hypothetical protein